MKTEKYNSSETESLTFAKQLKLSYDIIEAIVYKIAEIPEVSNTPDSPEDLLLVSELNRKLFEAYDLLIQYGEIEYV